MEDFFKNHDVTQTQRNPYLQGLFGFIGIIWVFLSFFDLVYAVDTITNINPSLLHLATTNSIHILAFVFVYAKAKFTGRVEGLKRAVRPKGAAPPVQVTDITFSHCLSL